MKSIKVFAIACSLISFASFAAQEFTKEEASNYIKIGEVSVTQDGFSMGNDELSKEVDEKGGKYYVITSTQGKEDHKNINADIYK